MSRTSPKLELKQVRAIETQPLAAYQLVYKVSLVVGPVWLTFMSPLEVLFCEGKASRQSCCEYALQQLILSHLKSVELA